MKIFLLCIAICLVVSVWLNLSFFGIVSSPSFVITQQEESSGTETSESSLWEAADIINDEEKNMVDYFSGLNKSSTVNLWSDYIYKDLKSISTVNDFKAFNEEYGFDVLLVGILKGNYEDLWIKFMSLQYDYYIDLQDQSFMDDLEAFGGYTQEATKDKFLSFGKDKFKEIQKGIQSLSKEDINMDLNVYFNKLPIVEALSNCKTIRKLFPEKYAGDKTSCEDKIYFYRATKQNQYCAEVRDPYKQQVCKDFLVRSDK